MNTFEKQNMTIDIRKAVEKVMLKHTDRKHAFVMIIDLDEGGEICSNVSHANAVKMISAVSEYLKDFKP